MQSVIKFLPILKERPWGGRAIAGLGAGRPLPPGGKIGESWEISDRPGDESVIAHGEFQGRTLRWLLDEHGTEVMGCPWKRGQRFPLLVKILDAAERLSLQVHPPARMATELKGEPKTEIWYLLDAAPGAAVLAGLKKGVTRDDFEKNLRSGKLESLIHRIPVKRGDAIFIPSGRVHAIDAGCLILEIQQNSDTTYRVNDWGRVGLDGKPRQMHLKESMKSIDFEDFEPVLISTIPETARMELKRSANQVAAETGMRGAKEFLKSSAPWIEREIVKSDLFTVQWRLLMRGMECGRPAVLHVLKGQVDLRADGNEHSAPGVIAEVGETLLLTGVPHTVHAMSGPAELLLTTWP